MFIVIEIQATNEEKVATLVFSYTNLNDAYSKYHTILSAAAISTVWKHSAVVLDDSGALLKRESYIHET